MLYLMLFCYDREKGSDTVVLASIKTEDAQKLFPKGVNVVRPW